MRVSANLFQLLGVDASAGRALLPEDDDPARRHVVVLTHDCWQRCFGGDPQLIGKNLTLNGESYQAVGIMPPNYSLPNKDAELAIPLAPDADPLRSVRSATNYLRGIARLQTGVTRQQAESDLTAIVTRQRQQYGDIYLKKTGVHLVQLQDEIVGDVSIALWVLLGSVGLVLLIACSNLAALSLARASSHQREIAIRKALGATTTRVIRQRLTESLILAFVGGVAGVLLAIWGVRFLVALSPTGLPRQQEIGVDLRVLAFAAAAALLSAAIFGILPALQAARGEASGALWITGRGAGEGAQRNRSRNVLVAAEVAVSFVLLISAGLLIQSFRRVQAIEPGFDPSNTLSIRLSLPKAYKDREAVARFADLVQSRIQNLPGVEAVGAVNAVPMSFNRHLVDFNFVGRALTPDDTYTAQYSRIRLALGARRMNIFRLVLAQGLKVVVAGITVGALGAFAATRVIRSLLFGVTPTDTITFIVVSLMLVLIALIACSAPARRATRVDPLIALRNE